MYGNNFGLLSLYLVKNVPFQTHQPLQLKSQANLTKLAMQQTPKDGSSHQPSSWA